MVPGRTPSTGPGLGLPPIFIPEAKPSGNKASQGARQEPVIRTEPGGEHRGRQTGVKATPFTQGQGHITGTKRRAKREDDTS